MAAEVRAGRGRAGRSVVLGGGVAPQPSAARNAEGLHQLQDRHGAQTVVAGEGGGLPDLGSEMPPTGAGGASGAGARPRVFTGLIHPDLLVLEEDSEDKTCGVCLGVLVDPATCAKQCPPVCSACWVSEIRDVGKCPTCGDGVADQSQLHELDHSQAMIAKLRMRCKHAARRVQALLTLYPKH